MGLQAAPEGLVLGSKKYCHSKLMPNNKSAFVRYRIIDSCLTNGLRKYPTLKDIQEKISDQLGEISIDMIRKDIEAIKEIWDAPVKYDSYHKGYYYTQEEFSIKEFPLTTDQVNALDFSTALLTKLKGSSLYDEFEAAINKIIKGNRLREIISKSERQILQSDDAIMTEGNKWIQPLLQAIVERVRVEILYHPFQREEKVHSVSPYVLKEYMKRWYLIGFSNSKQDITTLALDRIAKVSKSNEVYYKSDSFSEEAYFNYCIGIMKEGEPERVVLEFSEFQSKYIESQPLHKTQIIKERKLDGKLVIELYVYITYELVRLILGYGDKVRVVEPDCLKITVTKSIKKTLNNYT
jgi:predicted DNA-binding transcriptional regulator YafY